MEEEVKFTKNKRLIEKDTSGHAGGPLYRKPIDLLDSQKLNKHGLSLNDI